MQALPVLCTIILCDNNCCPVRQPIKNVTTIVDKTAAGPPTLASAAFPTKRPTMIVSTVVYNCWINVPSMIGKKKINSCFQITPSVIAFFSIVFSPIFCPSPAFSTFFVFSLCNFPFIQFQKSDIPTFITPARTITHIGFIFTFRSNIIQTTKITARLHFVPASAI